MTQEEARGDALVSAAIPQGDVRLFELLPSGMIRVITPTPRGQKKTTLDTPRRLLSYLNCSTQWEPAFQAALEQAVLGQSCEVELRTMDPEETWIQLRINPLPDNEVTTAIGAIRDVTQEVKERHRREEAAKLLDRMTDNTIAGLEISLEDDTLRLLWGEPAYQALFAPVVQVKPYSAILQEVILPTIHPQDREKYGLFMGRTALLTDFLAGSQPPVEEYRVKSDQALGYEWHSAEFFCFWDPVSHKAMCNVFVRQVTEEKMRQLEEKRRLEEKEHTLFLQAKQLVESEEELDFVHVISDYYQGIYVVDLEKDLARSIKVPRYFEELLQRAGHCQSKTLDLYCQELMDPDYVASFRAVTDYDNLRQKLQTQRQVELLFHKRDDTWLRLRVFAMPGYTPESQKTLWVFEDNTTTVNLRQEEEKARVTAQAAQAASQAKSQFLANMSHDIRTPPQRHPGHVRTGPAGGEQPGKGQLLPGHPGQRPGAAGEHQQHPGPVQDRGGEDGDHPGELPGPLRLPRHHHHPPDAGPGEEAHLPGPGGRDHPQHPLRGRHQPHPHRHEPGLQRRQIHPDGDHHPHRHLGARPGGGGRGPLHPHGGHRHRHPPGGPALYLPELRPPRPKGQPPHRGHRPGAAHLPAAHPAHGRPAGGGEHLRPGQHLLGAHPPKRWWTPPPCGPYRDGEQRENNRNYNSFTAPEAVVLVVDDQPLNLKVCQGLLGPYEMEVYTARSGQEALRQMTQVWPDLVLMDHMMPGMDGVEATARIREMGRKDPYFAVVPIVALTANAMKGVREEFLQKGFNDFLPKPIELDKLDNVLRAWTPEDKQKAPAPALGDLVAEPIPEDLQRLPGIDVARGMSYCGTGQVYRKTLFLFREQIPGRLRRIRKAQETEQWEDYVIEVHSLKSAARWIGAMDLGDQAEALEMAGREGDREKVAAGTPELLRQCQTLGETLAFLKEPE